MLPLFALPRYTGSHTPSSEGLSQFLDGECCDVRSLPCLKIVINSTFTQLLSSLEDVDGWLVECCFTSTKTVGLLGTGAQDGHLDFHTAPEF